MMIQDEGAGPPREKRPPGWRVTPAAEAMLLIGTNPHPAGHFQALDEVAIWGRGLSEREIAAIFNGGHGVEIPTR